MPRPVERRGSSRHRVARPGVGAQDSKVVRVAPTVFIDLADTARLEGGGEALLIEATTACPVGSRGQESQVAVYQGQASGRGVFVPTCDGRPQTSTVRIQAGEGTFQAGAAQASAFVTVEDRGDVFFGDDTHPFEIVVT